MNSPIGPVDASKVPVSPDPPRSPGCPRLDQVAKRRRRRRRRAVRLRASPTGPAPGSAPPTSASPPGCCAATTRAMDVSPFELDPGGRRRRYRREPVQHPRGHRGHRGRRPATSPADGTSLVTIGGDHTIALPLLRRGRQRTAPSRCVHFDAHLDTWDTYFGAEYTRGTRSGARWRRASSTPRRSATSARRGPLYGKKDLDDDRRFGFGIVTSSDVYYQAAFARSSTSCGSASGTGRCTSPSTSTCSTPPRAGHRHPEAVG